MLKTNQSVMLEEGVMNVMVLSHHQSFTQHPRVILSIYNKHAVVKMQQSKEIIIEIENQGSKSRVSKKD